MFPVVNSRWRVMGVIPVALHIHTSPFSTLRCPRRLVSLLRFSAFSLPLGSSSWEQGQRWEGGKGGSRGIYSSTPSLSAEMQAPIRKPSLSGSGNRSPPCAFKMLRFPESLGYSTISRGFPIPCSLLYHIFPVRTLLDTKVWDVCYSSAIFVF